MAWNFPGPVYYLKQKWLLIWPGESCLPKWWPTRYLSSAGHPALSAGVHEVSTLISHDGSWHASTYYCMSSHISRIFKVRKWGQNKGCDLYEGHEYNASQRAPIPENWAIPYSRTCPNSRAPLIFVGKNNIKRCLCIGNFCVDHWFPIYHKEGIQD